MSTAGPVQVLLDTPTWQVFAQPWPVRDGPERWAWGVAARDWPGLLLEGIESGLAYFRTARGGRPWFTTLPARSRVMRIANDEAWVDGTPNIHGLMLTWEMRISPVGPLMWRLHVTHQGQHPVWLHRWTLLRVGPAQPLRRGIFGRFAGAVSNFSRRVHAPEMEHPGALRLHAAPAALAFYAHAWASWGQSRVYFDQPARPQARFLLDRVLPPRHDPAAPRPRGPNRFYSDLFGILADREHRRGLLLGFAGQREFFGGLQVRLDRLQPHAHLLALGDRVLLEPGDQAVTDWAVLWAFDLDDPEGLAAYVRATAQILDLPAPRATPPTGWLSWYEYFREVTAAQVRANADAARDLAAQGVRLQVMQVDDGYAAVPAMWEPPLREGFGSTLATLAADLRARGFQPGVWQAPFIAHRAAARRLKPMLRRRGLGPAFAGWVWNTLTFGLDPSHPAARERAIDMARDAARQGFTYLKLDFLYAGALPGSRRDPKRSRAAALYAALRDMLRAFREEAGPEATVLLCGVPLGTALGLADAVRIGPDVDPHWQMPHPLPAVRRHPDVPGLGRALRAVLLRAFLHRGWWLNDPDPLLPTAAGLTPAEQETWHTVVGMLGGPWFVSADLTRLTPEARARLKRVFPPLQGRFWVVDLWDADPPRRIRLDLDGPLGPWQVVAVLNWTDAPARVTVRPEDYGLDPEAVYWVRPFWKEDAPFRRAAQAAWEVTLPPHGVGVWAVHPERPAPQFVGSDLHLGQGAEVRDWRVAPDGVAFTLDLPGPRQGRVWLTLPAAPRTVQVNGAAAAWHGADASNLYALEVAFHDRAQVEVTW
ncbi:MAG: hypothetical protein GXO37_02290 [Chloroflexi bacterium]|nr:hypothetical protein [Chloroflexota bacterium]